MSAITLRAMSPSEWSEVAALIHSSTNAWYKANRGFEIFACPPEACEIFCKTYEALDPGCCTVAVDDATGQIVGSCFVHPRGTHISLGIVNVHPDAFGKGVARAMLAAAIARADAEGKPLRLVSSAMNLDSFSLYTRAGLVPRMVFQDVLFMVPEAGLNLPAVPESGRVRPATLDDVPAIAALDTELTGLSREKDWRHFAEDRDGVWKLWALEGDGGRLDGAIARVAHPASTMVGPGAARTQGGAAALVRAALDSLRGRSAVVLAPCDAAELVATLYAWGGRNVELHVAQCRGAWTAPTGVFLPTFLPETG